MPSQMKRAIQHRRRQERWLENIKRQQRQAAVMKQRWMRENTGPVIDAEYRMPPPRLTTSGE